MSRIILMSDLHLCHINWYGRTSEERLEKMLLDIEEEQKREPIDMIVMCGDYSLDYWECAPYGSFSVNGISNTARFLDDFASRLPCPFYIIPGNHEQYTHEDWERVTGFRRQYAVISGDNLFLMLDTFGANLNASEHNHGTYLPADVEFIKAEMAKNPGKKVFLCAHDFYFETESEEFRTLVRENDNVIALFGGHTHVSYIYPMGEDYANKCLCRTGEYSYTKDYRLPDLWGYRELIITPNKVTTSYIVPAHSAKHGEDKLECEYHRTDEAVLFERK